IGNHLANDGQRLLAVTGLAHYASRSGRLHDGSNPGPDQGFVVDEHRSDHCHCWTPVTMVSMDTSSPEEKQSRARSPERSESWSAVRAYNRHVDPGGAPSLAR